VGVVRDKLYTALKLEMIDYANYNGEFIRHTEIDLIKYLINNDFSPAVNGLSKLSCILCIPGSGLAQNYLNPEPDLTF